MSLKIIIRLLGIILKNATIVIPFIEGVLKGIDDLKEDIKKNNSDSEVSK